MQRRGQPPAGREIALTALGADEVQRMGVLEAVVDAGVATEVKKLGAAAHRNVLAEIDRFADLRIGKRSGAAAERLGLLEQFHAHSALAGGNGGSQPRQPTADDRNSRSLIEFRESHALLKIVQGTLIYANRQKRRRSV